MDKLLIANRGEIACRVVRTARAMGIATVAVFSDPDADAPHVGDADESVHLRGATPASTYLDADRILDAARRTGADAIHPGYGFLSENAAFARACEAAGVTFVGPSPEAIEAMGSKIAAKETMAAAGVPVLGAEGFPLLVKAAFGGGGRGMRIVRDQGELDEALASAEREAAAAFGDGTVFVERYVEQPRHIEVQILGDRHGNVVHLFERECSIQRRYQKIIEEAPSPTIGPELREELCDAAVRAGRALGYVGAGTVEFVVGPDGEFHFLEVNTRLQVEHPVTELVTGLDLVELQLLVAMGERLDLEPTVSGHAIEARLYAEDVTAGFAPSSGRLARFDLPAPEGVRVDAGYDSGGLVSTHYDAMLAKVIAHGRDRRQAVGRLVHALESARVHGPATNRRLLVGVLTHPEFTDARIDTGFLERHDPSVLGAEAVPPAHALAAALAERADRRQHAAVQPSIPAGWRNVPSQPLRTTFTHAGREVPVEYRLDRAGAEVSVDGVHLDVEVRSATHTRVDLSVDGVRHHLEVELTADAVYVDGAGASSVFGRVDRWPDPASSVPAGSLQAPLPGAVTRVLVEAGDAVLSGQALVVLEAMKMEHTVTSATDGTVTDVLVAVGDQVDEGQSLVVIEEGNDG
jgi:acetyl/propionyl-CoA carboxylase alpha subunit